MSGQQSTAASGEQSVSASPPKKRQRTQKGKTKSASDKKQFKITQRDIEIIFLSWRHMSKKGMTDEQKRGFAGDAGSKATDHRATMEALDRVQKKMGVLTSVQFQAMAKSVGSAAIQAGIEIQEDVAPVEGPSI